MPPSPRDKRSGQPELVKFQNVDELFSNMSRLVWLMERLLGEPHLFNPRYVEGEVRPGDILMVLKVARQIANVGQAEMAHHMGYSNTVSYSDLENGRLTYLDLDKIKRAFGILGYEVNLMVRRKSMEVDLT